MGKDCKQQKLMPGQETSPSSNIYKVLSCQKFKLIPGRGMSWQKI